MLQFEVFTVTKIQVMVFWGVTACSRIPLWRCRQNGPLKCWYPTTSLNGVTTQKTIIWISQEHSLLHLV